MADPKPDARPLFAQKGAAVPSPAVAYVSLHQMRGQTERRAEEPDRRAQQQDAREHEGAPDDGRDRRGPDYGGRRHYTPREGLAHGQEPVDWAPTAPPAPPAPPPAGDAAKPASPLSSLISRHGVAGAPSPRPVPAVPLHYAQPSEARHRIDVTKHLSTAGSDDEPAAVVAPPPPKRRKRKKLTVRLGLTKFQQIYDLAENADRTYQSILEAAITDFLEKQD
jgi:hypothetical protein